jgi:hypothetical protein
MKMLKYLMWSIVYRGVTKAEHDQLLIGARQVVAMGGPAPQVAKDYIAFYEKKFPDHQTRPQPYQDTEPKDYGPTDEPIIEF